VVLWLVGDLVIGKIGRYGDTNTNLLPEWWDLVVVLVWSLAIFPLAINQRLEPNGVSEEVAKDAFQLSSLDELDARAGAGA
jgi:hypothetical protein